jgi:hypothetical protein
VWRQQAKLKPNDQKKFALFSSWNVALDGDTAVVGSLTDNQGGFFVCA